MPWTAGKTHVVKMWLPSQLLWRICGCRRKATSAAGPFLFEKREPLRGASLQVTQDMFHWLLNRKWVRFCLPWTYSFGFPIPVKKLAVYTTFSAVMTMKWKSLQMIKWSFGFSHLVYRRLSAHLSILWSPVWKVRLRTIPLCNHYRGVKFSCGSWSSCGENPGVDLKCLIENKPFRCRGSENLLLFWEESFSPQSV